MNSSDKIPVLVLTIAVFIYTIIFDWLDLPKKNKCLKLLYTVVDFFKYNFFIRLGVEMFLELFINALINLYYVRDYSITL